MLTHSLGEVPVGIHGVYEPITAPHFVYKSNPKKIEKTNPGKFNSWLYNELLFNLFGGHHTILQMSR